MKNVVDFDKVRKKRQRLHRFRQTIILTGLVALVFAAIYINDVLIQQNAGAHLSDFFNSFGGTGYPTDLPGGVIRETKNIGANLAVLNDTNLYIYNKNGKITQNIPQMSPNTIFSPSSGRVLVFDVGSHKFSVYSPTKLLFSQEMADSILTGNLSENGAFAIVTSPRQYVAQVTAYNKQFEPVFNWYSAENLVAGVSVSPRGDMMAVGCLNAQNGVIKTIISFCRFDSDTETAKIELPDSMLVHIGFQGDKRLCVLTDREYLIFDSNGVRQHAYTLPASPVIAFETLGNYSLILTESRENRTQELTLLNGECSVAATMQSGKKILDMSLDQREIYILTDTGITVYNHAFEQVKSLEERGINGIHLTRNILYYFTRDEICVLSEEQSK